MLRILLQPAHLLRSHVIRLLETVGYGPGGLVVPDGIIVGNTPKICQLILSSLELLGHPLSRGTNLFGRCLFHAELVSSGGIGLPQIFDLILLNLDLGLQDLVGILELRLHNGTRMLLLFKLQREGTLLLPAGVLHYLRPLVRFFHLFQQLGLGSNLEMQLIF